MNNSNLILPAGDVKIGPIDYNLYTNSQLPSTEEINSPAEDCGKRFRSLRRGKAQDAQEIQTKVAVSMDSLCLSARSETGRRHKYDRRGEWH